MQCKPLLLLHGLNGRLNVYLVICWASALLTKCFYDPSKWQSHTYIDGLVQNCSISSALALEILQSCTKFVKALEILQSCTKLSIWDTNLVIIYSFSIKVNRFHTEYCCTGVTDDTICSVTYKWKGCHVGNLIVKGDSHFAGLHTSDGSKASDDASLS